MDAAYEKTPSTPLPVIPRDPLTAWAERFRPPIPNWGQFKMFMVSEDDAAAIRAAFERDGELSAAAELQRRFPGITDITKARDFARTIAGWQPPSAPPIKPRRRPRQA